MALIVGNGAYQSASTLATRPMTRGISQPRSAVSAFRSSRAPISGVGQLDDSKLPQLLSIKYRAVYDAARELGGIARIRETFIGFQKHLYARVG